MRRPRVIPVVSTWNPQVLSDVDTPEAEVSVAEGTILIEQLQSEDRNAGVKTNIMTGLAPQIAPEIPQATSELFEDDDLRLDVANLLGDNLLRNLLDDGKLLLNDRDSLTLAYVLLPHEEDSIVPEAIEIADSEEVVETGQRGEPSPVVERDV